MQNFLKKVRLEYHPPTPALLKDLSRSKLVTEKKKKPLKEICALFPNISSIPKSRIEQGESHHLKRKLRIGVLFSGGPASGGHNVVAGIFDGVQQLDKTSSCIGFIGGPSGLVENQFFELTQRHIDSVRNQGGFHLLGSGRTKIETPEQFLKAATAVEELKLDGLVIVGGDDSNTNAALFAEYLLEQGRKTCVVGVPKTIDGDLRSEELPISFGFDTATKTYSELIGNMALDALSAKKYYHFIRLMGRSASHITLECALRTHPNIALIGEEVKKESQSLKQIASSIAHLIRRRADKGKLYGVVLFPEGLIEFIPEIRELIEFLNRLGGRELSIEEVGDSFSSSEKEIWNQFPISIQKQLLQERDPHGYIQLSRVETEALLLPLVQKELGPTIPFQPVTHFLGYEGRSAFPSNFDATYAYALGRLAAFAVFQGQTAVMCALENLQDLPYQWKPKLLPLSHWLHFEIRKGKRQAVIRKSLVDLKGRPFQYFLEKRAEWQEEDLYQIPGPIQFFGGSEVSDSIPVTLSL